MVSEVAGVDVTVAPPLVQQATPVAALRCWWCDGPIATTDDGEYQLCMNTRCEAYMKPRLDWTAPPLCEERTGGGYGRMAVSPPEYCEALSVPGTSRCTAHTYDEQWDEPFDDDGPVFLVEGHEHNDYGM